MVTATARAEAPAQRKKKPRASPQREGYAVWEITLKCNLACKHCGSRAGHEREKELSTKEALDLVAQLADVGITEVTLIGGEAFLRPDWLQLIEAITDAGMAATMATGGYGLNRATAKKMKEAGLAQVSVSVDGLEASHDALRGKPGSFQHCFKAMAAFKEVGLPFAVNTQINRHSAPELPEIYERIRDAGARGWQYTLTVPMGGASEWPDNIIQPFELIDLYPVLARITARAHAEGMIIMPGNDIGYFGPYETLLRKDHIDLGCWWTGCCAGTHAVGIEADGKIKGCSSLPTEAYVGGNIREAPLREILQRERLTLNMHGGTPKAVEHLWGHCRSCDFAELCRGGCMWTAHVFFDKPGNNPHCHLRALRLKARGLRERVAMRRAAQGKSFDHGVFELIEEPVGAPWPADDPKHFTQQKVVWPKTWDGWPWP